MISAVSSLGQSAALMQSQRAATTLSNQLDTYQRKLSTMNAQAGTVSEPSKAQIAQISGQISTIKTQLTTVHVSPSVQSAQPVQPTYSSRGLVKASASSGSRLDATA